MAARDIDLEKTMRYILIFTSFGFAIISFLSLLGILGSIFVIDDYGHGNPNELRYVLGFGHPNTLFSSIYSILLLWVWNYGKKAKWWHFAIITLFMIIICFITSSRTSIIISLLTIVLTVIARFLPNIAKKDISYITAGFISPILCVIFSMYSAGISHIIPYLWEKDWRSILDSSLTNRIKDLYYSNDRHSGAIETWELFSNRTSTEYFDMGWVRMFYWYGIIPTTFIIIAIIFLLYLCSKEKDIWTTILVISLGTYTTIEATYVSSYIGRNFMLIILGAYIGKWLKGNCISNYHSE
ncbi:hypothetical protein [Butyrivibrio proteoclasticus]|nr:hypothetical protein [Butyrivibrio proteoclasticus]